MDRFKDTFRRYFIEWYPRGPSVAAVRITALFVCVFLVLTLLSGVSYQGQPDHDPSGALACYLEQQGIMADRESIHWITSHGDKLLSDMHKEKVIFLARTSDEPLRDFYFAKVRLTPSGKVAGAGMWNLSKTPFCSEHGLWAKGSVVAVAGMVMDGFTNISFYDFRGEYPGNKKSWSLIEKIKDSITNYQKTGQLDGVNSAFMEFRRPQKGLSVELNDSSFLVRFDEGSAAINISAAGFSPEESGESLFEFQTVEKAVYGHVAWVVDTARATQLIGKEKIGWAEAKWYRFKDFFKRNFHKIAGSDYSIRSIKEEMGEVNEDNETINEFLAGHAGGSFPDLTPPDVAPDENLKPMEGEGKWKPILDEIFNLRDENAPPSLYRTFARPDPDRPYAYANLVAWDPGMVELHVAAGAVEPKNKIGKAGTGMIPRDKETMTRLLAGFNGGFQALHGEFGLMQNGKVYLPPKPWAATVALLKGGKIGFGTWPGPKAGEIPPEIVSYRQNLTPLMQDSKINPYKRSWWGSSPDLNPDSPMIARSGICWTESNHILYGLAYSVNEYTFAKTMKRAGCHYLIQLDVNAGHSGFEFIRVTPENETAAPAGSLDKNWEAEGKVTNGENLIFRSKKLFKKMTLMRFPRYIGKEPRDFFYITLKKNLPGPAIAPGKGEIDGWNVDAVPGNTFPPSFAYAAIHIEERSVVKLVRVDPRWTAIGVQAAGGDKTAKEGALLKLPSSVKLHVSGTAQWSLEKGEPAIIFGYDQQGDEWRVMVEKWDNKYLDEFNRAFALEIPEENGGPPAGAIGIGPDRFFAWAESSDNDMNTLTEALRRAGAKKIIKIPAAAGESAGWSFIGSQNGEVKVMALMGKKAEAPAPTALTFSPADRAGIVRLFPDTDIVLPKTWNPPQIKRIRYFKPEPQPDAGVDKDGE